MREPVFIKQNIARWRDYQRRLDHPAGETPDMLAQMYTELTSDLAFSRTHFPDAAITQMLNAMTLKLHNEIYSSRQEKWSRLLTFWTQEVPQAVYDNRKAMLAALAVFVLFLGIGIVSIFNDADFARTILGDDYVDMTIENIKNGTPTNVYSSGPEAESFFFIMLNNLRVDVICVSMGIFTPFFTAIVVMYNAIMVGAFTMFFFQYGVLGDALLAIMQHGTLEISTMVLSGGGMVVPRHLQPHDSIPPQGQGCTENRPEHISRDHRGSVHRGISHTAHRVPAGIQGNGDYPVGHVYCLLLHYPSPLCGAQRAKHLSE